MIDIVSARTIVVLADCHIHSQQGVGWPAAALAAFGNVDLFVTLGDMGERAGLDTLAALAPVLGVRGRDDQEDPRTNGNRRVLCVGRLRIGCIFDPVETGVAEQVAPLVCRPASQWPPPFDTTLDALLWASTHVPSLTRADNGLLLVNPGSVTLPAEGAAASFARLTLGRNTIAAEIVEVPQAC